MKKKNIFEKNKPNGAFVGKLFQENLQESPLKPPSQEYIDINQLLLELDNAIQVNNLQLSYIEKNDYDVRKNVQNIISILKSTEGISYQMHFNTIMNFLGLNSIL
jgi:hypothetical protein